MKKAWKITSIIFAFILVLSTFFACGKVETIDNEKVKAAAERLKMTGSLFTDYESVVYTQIDLANGEVMSNSMVKQKSGEITSSALFNTDYSRYMSNKLNYDRSKGEEYFAISAGSDLLTYVDEHIIVGDAVYKSAIKSSLGGYDATYESVLDEETAESYKSWGLAAGDIMRSVLHINENLDRLISLRFFAFYTLEKEETEIASAEYHYGMQPLYCYRTKQFLKGEGTIDITINYETTSETYKIFPNVKLDIFCDEGFDIFLDKQSTTPFVVPESGFTENTVLYYKSKA